jgi:flagellar biosynthetic protein FlhB
VEVIAAVSLLAMFAGFKVLGPYLISQFAALLTRYLSGDVLLAYQTLNIDNLTSILAGALLAFAMIAVPILFIALLIGVLANVMQVGFMFSTKALAPKMDRINPLQGMKRLFSSRTLYELAKSLIKITLIVIIAYSAYTNNMQNFPKMMTSDLLSSISKMVELIINTAFTLCIALLILSVFDYAYQWWRHEKDLRMTKYEVKLEYKQQEGDPQLKSKIQQKQRQMAMMRMMQSVPEADVVITNPTHFAVALKYDQQNSSAPVVLAKGKDYVAQKIKDIAKDHKIEIVENKPVAQSLFRSCEIGKEIPLELYAAVAEILAYVYKLKNKLGERK